MYYNPETKQIISRVDLKKLLNASIPENIEEVNGWFLLHNGDTSETQPGQSIIADEIIFENNQYIQTYKVVGQPVSEANISYEDRIAALERGLTDLAQLASERY